MDPEHFTKWTLIVDLAMNNRFHTGLVFSPRDQTDLDIGQRGLGGIDGEQNDL